MFKLHLKHKKILYRNICLQRRHDIGTKARMQPYTNNINHVQFYLYLNFFFISLFKYHVGVYIYIYISSRNLNFKLSDDIFIIHKQKKKNTVKFFIDNRMHNVQQTMIFNLENVFYMFRQNVLLIQYTIILYILLLSSETSKYLRKKNKII